MRETEFGFPTLLVDDFKLKVRVVTTAVTHTLYLTRDALDDIAAAYVVVANYIEGCAVTREEFDKWVEVEGDARTAAHKRLADLDELRADIKRQQDAAQRQAEEAKARIEGRERRNAALARRGTVAVLSGSKHAPATPAKRGRCGGARIWRARVQPRPAAVHCFTLRLSLFLGRTPARPRTRGGARWMTHTLSVDLALETLRGSRGRRREACALPKGR